MQKPSGGSDSCARADGCGRDQGKLSQHRQRPQPRQHPHLKHKQKQRPQAHPHRSNVRQLRLRLCLRRLGVLLHQRWCAPHELHPPGHCFRLASFYSITHPPCSLGHSRDLPSVFDVSWRHSSSTSLNTNGCVRPHVATSSVHSNRNSKSLRATASWYGTAGAGKFLLV